MILSSLMVGIPHPRHALPLLAARPEYAKTLLATHPAASLVFAATSAELTWKSAILRPLVFGIVHVEPLANLIVERAVPKQGGLTNLYALHSAILKEVAGIDLST